MCISEKSKSIVLYICHKNGTLLLSKYLNLDLYLHFPCSLEKVLLRIFVSVCMCGIMYVCGFVCVLYVCMCACIYRCVPVYICVCVYIYICAYMHISICVHVCAWCMHTCVGRCTYPNIKSSQGRPFSV